VTTSVRPRAIRLVLTASAVAACLAVAAVATAGSPLAYTAYVANFGSGSVTPINAATNAASSPTSVNDPSAVAITPDGKKALVANWTEGTVTPVTLATMTAGTPITVGNQPAAIAITPTARRPTSPTTTGTARARSP